MSNIKFVYICGRPQVSYDNIYWHFEDANEETNRTKIPLKSVKSIQKHLFIMVKLEE